MFILPQDTLRVSTDLRELNQLGELEERRLFLYGEISSVEGCDDVIDGCFSNAAALVKKILLINQKDKEIAIKDRKPIIIYINSPGGELVEGFALVSVMEHSKTPVYTVNIGEWCSMAFLIGITGTKRYSLPYMTFLMHEASGVSVGKISSMEERIDFDRKFSERIVKQHVLNHSTMSEREYELVAKKELYMLPEDALGYGFIDEIITDLDTIL